MRNYILNLLPGIIFFACNNQPTQQDFSTVTKAPIVGTWQLFRATLIEKGDTTVTDYTQKASFIKVINDTHFVFLQHDLNGGKGPGASFSAGGGRYDLKDSLYTEHLTYCNDRQWEGHDFPFTITLKGDTLVQQGVEKVESAGIDRLNIEEYIRVKP